MKISFMKSHQRLLQYTDASNLFDSLGAWIHIVLNCIIYAALISQIWLLSMQPRISKLTIQFVFWTTHNFHFIHRKIRTIYQKSFWNIENGLKTSFDELSLKWMEVHDFLWSALSQERLHLFSLVHGHSLWTWSRLRSSLISSHAKITKSDFYRL